ncbi:hypothetical protein ABVK25_003116 [Lepraria finkii]|uniref:Uncharacterized protein n=1 Tax=Lepraria finkii TaxID=1340010 RepID=A0ABR4BFV6_9LECA
MLLFGNSISDYLSYSHKSFDPQTKNLSARLISRTHSPELGLIHCYLPISSSRINSNHKNNLGPESTKMQSYLHGVKQRDKFPYVNDDPQLYSMHLTTNSASRLLIHPGIRAGINCMDNFLARILDHRSLPQDRAAARRHA